MYEHFRRVFENDLRRSGQQRRVSRGRINPQKVLRSYVSLFKCSEGVIPRTRVEKSIVEKRCRGIFGEVLGTVGLETRCRTVAGEVSERVGAEKFF